MLLKKNTKNVLSNISHLCGLFYVTCDAPSTFSWWSVAKIQVHSGCAFNYSLPDSWILIRKDWISSEQSIKYVNGIHQVFNHMTFIKSNFQHRHISRSMWTLYIMNHWLTGVQLVISLHLCFFIFSESRCWTCHSLIRLESEGLTNRVCVRVCGIKPISTASRSYPFTPFYISGEQRPVSIQLGNWPYIFTSEKVN